MKKLSIIFFSVLLQASLSAQNFSITEQRTKTEEGQEADAWIAHLDQPIDFGKKTFSKFIKANFSVKTDDKSKTVLFVEKARFSDISSLRGDLRAIYNPEGTGCTVAFIFSPGYDIHLNKANFPQEFAKMQTLVKKFVKFHYAEFYNESLKELDSKIEEKQDFVTKSRKKIESLKKEMADNETEINAGSKKADKLRDRNVKHNTEITTLQTKILEAEADIVKLYESKTKTDETLKKVNEFQ
jgi:hypothetical protein